MKFEWDDAKALANLQKHGVRFEEAQTVFDDDQARITADQDHSVDEDRELIIGYSFKGRVLVSTLCSTSRKHPNYQRTNRGCSRTPTT